MTHYVAFLRAINVRGHALVKMSDLCAAFESAGCHEVWSYIQSGNVVFATRTTDPASLFARIRRKVRKLSGSEPEIVYRSLAALETLTRTRPFDGLEDDRALKCYVAFLSATPVKRPRLPLQDPREYLEVIAVKGRDVLLVSRRKPGGMYGFPNACIEHAFGVPATSRNWNTVRNIVEKAKMKAT